MAEDDWSRRFEEQLVGCPGCGTTCDNEHRPIYVASTQSPFQRDNYVREVYWYHTSTHANWPDQSYDPEATLDDPSRRRMESQIGTGAVQRWALRQKRKALHVGSYEAAIENMIRRIRDQVGSAEQFFLYRVVLDRSCRMAPGLNDDRMGLIGDIELSELCSPSQNVYRYINRFEDVSSVSLALNLDAISKVQRIAIPLPFTEPDETVQEIINQLVYDTMVEPPNDDDPLSRIRARVLTVEERRKQYVTGGASKLVTSVARTLPWSPGRNFTLALAGTSRHNISEFASKVVGMKLLIEDSDSVLQELDNQPWRVLGKRK